MWIKENRSKLSGGFRITHFNAGICVRLIQNSDNGRSHYYLTVGNAEAINLSTGIRRDITPDDRFVEVEAEISILS